MGGLAKTQFLQPVSNNHPNILGVEDCHQIAFQSVVLLPLKNRGREFQNFAVKPMHQCAKPMGANESTHRFRQL